MKFGIHSVNLHTCAYPDAGARLAKAAEAAGFAADTGRALGLTG